MGRKKSRFLSYSRAGVDRDTENETKKEFSAALKTTDAHVLNTIGAFASLYDGSFPSYKHPILVLKTEEPGTKQLLALQYDRVETVCHDLINHLVNDCVTMGAKPLSVQDCIVCGRVEKNIVVRMVRAFAEAAKHNEATLTGGETSWQPGVIAAGTYILTASIVGVVEKKRIIDGALIREGDRVIALASSGVHTNGISLVREIIRTQRRILSETIGGRSFIDAILTPHRPYYRALKGLFGTRGLVGLAHITGGGIEENLDRILPRSLDAEIDLNAIRIHPVFLPIRKYGRLRDAEMLRTFNMGVGMIMVVRASYANKAIAHIKQCGIDAYDIGTIKRGKRNVRFLGKLAWE